MVAPRPPAADTEQRLLNALHEVEDAELPVDVVDLGLIYGLDYEPERGHVSVRMTFTAMGCPAMEFMVADVRERLLREPDVASVEVEIVWDPPWNQGRLTERGAAALSTWGIVG